MLTHEQLKKAVQEFKAIYKEEFGIELNDADATQKALRILQLFNCLTLATEV